jgi:multiple sugar transport system permease protein
MRPALPQVRSPKPHDTLFALALLAPAFAIFGVVVVLPIAKGIYVSFCECSLATLTRPSWNNFANYKVLFGDGQILLYLRTTLVYVSCTVLVQLVMGMGIALLMNMPIAGRAALRGLFLVPWTIPSVVVAILWKWMLQQQFGVLNYLLYSSRLTSTVNIAWFQDDLLAMMSVVMAAVWRQLPYMMVMLLAGLQSVDTSLIEAASIEGAGGPQVFRYVTLPSIRPVIIAAVWISIMDNFQMFTIVFNMTAGGPVEATTTLSVATYRRAFTSYNFGQASAIGVIWMAILVLAAVYFNKLSARSTAAYQ